jgi:hypothetical protein
MNEGPPVPTVLYGRRPGAAVWCGVAVLAAAFGATMVAGGAWAGWVLVVIFLPAAVLLGLSLRPAANELRIDHEGYTVTGLRAAVTVAWADVERIGVHDGTRDPLVAIRFVPSVAGRDPQAADVAAALGGYHRTLPLTYGRPADELAALMDRYRLR